MKNPPNKKYWLFENNQYTKSAMMTDDEASDINAHCAKKGYHFRWVIPVFPDLKGRHVASLRSICETFGGKDPYCTCGKVYNDPIHFTRKEIDKLSIEAKMVAYGDNNT